MKNLLRTLAAGLLAPVMTAQASTTYEDIVAAATNPQDLLRQALVTIFGDVVTNPLAGGNTTIIGNLFAVFNGIIAILAVIWFIIIGLKHINKAGHQGKAFSGGFSGDRADKQWVESGPADDALGGLYYGRGFG